MIIHRGTLPDDPTLVSNNWDYCCQNGSYPHITTDNKDDALTVYAAARNNGPWCHGGQMAYIEGGSFNPDGTYSWYPIFGGFQMWVTDVMNNGGASRYYINLQAHFINHDGTTFKGFTYGTTAFNNAVKNWFGALRDVIMANGWDPHQFAFAVNDEPDPGHPCQRYADFVALARTGAPEFLFYNDPHLLDVSDVNTGFENFMLQCDIIMPALNHLVSYPSVRVWWQNFAATHGKELGTYASPGGGHTRSPVTDFRRWAWIAQNWQMGCIGEWTGTGIRTNTWDDFGSTHNYEMIFTTPTTATAGKALMGWRDGSQDYEYFRVLESLVAQAQALALDPALITASQDILDNLAGNTIASLPWNTNWIIDSTVNTAFDTARLQLLAAIDALDLAVALATVEDCDDLWAAYLGDPADINHDCHVDLGDLTALADDWLADTDGAADINADSHVDLGDLPDLRTAWGTCNDPCDPICP